MASDNKKKIKGVKIFVDIWRGGGGGDHHHSNRFTAYFFLST